MGDSNSDKIKNRLRHNHTATRHRTHKELYIHTESRRRRHPQISIPIRDSTIKRFYKKTIRGSE